MKYKNFLFCEFPINMIENLLIEQGNPKPLTTYKSGFGIPNLSVRSRLYLKLSLDLSKIFKPTPVESLREKHILDINELSFFTRGLSNPLTLLPLGTAFNRVPSSSFQDEVVVKALRSFPNIIRCFANLLFKLTSRLYIASSQ